MTRRGRMWLGIAALFVSSLAVDAAVGPGSGVPAATDGTVHPPTDQLVAPGPVEPRRLWPYTSRTLSTEGRTLALTAVVAGDDGRTSLPLTNRSGVDWGNSRATPTSSTPRGTSLAARWDTPPSHRARTRPVGWSPRTPRSTSATTPFRRVHVRAYGAPYENWTAHQAHARYWD